MRCMHKDRNPFGMRLAMRQLVKTTLAISVCDENIESWRGSAALDGVKKRMEAIEAEKNE